MVRTQRRKPMGEGSIDDCVVDNAWLEGADVRNAYELSRVARSTTRWTSASTTSRTRTGSSFTTRRQGHWPVLLRHRGVREPDRDYIGIAKGDLPRKVYYGSWRTFPARVILVPGDQTQRLLPDYDGVNVYEGAYPNGGTRLTPSWGGSMFEALMPALFVPEAVGRGLWRATPYTVDARSNGCGWRSTACGASRRQHRGRLRRVRRRRAAWTERHASTRTHARRPWLRGCRRPASDAAWRTRTVW